MDTLGCFCRLSLVAFVKIIFGLGTGTFGSFGRPLVAVVQIIAGCFSWIIFLSIGSLVLFEHCSIQKPWVTYICVYIVGDSPMKSETRLVSADAWSRYFVLY